MSLHDQLRDIALTEFASAGYAGTSLQRIADLAGTSKASVLYHYDSKERLLEAAIGPALDDLRGFIDGMTIDTFAPEYRAAFVERFVDFLLAHRQVVHLVINQGSTLDDVPVIHRAVEQMRRLATFFELAAGSTVEKLRFGIALGGAAYCLASADELGVDQADDAGELRDSLVTVISQLLVPLTVRAD